MLIYPHRDAISDFASGKHHHPSTILYLRKSWGLNSLTMQKREMSTTVTRAPMMIRYVVFRVCWKQSPDVGWLTNLYVSLYHCITCVHDRCYLLWKSHSIHKWNWTKFPIYLQQTAYQKHISNVISQNIISPRLLSFVCKQQLFTNSKTREKETNTDCQYDI